LAKIVLISAADAATRLKFSRPNSELGITGLQVQANGSLTLSLNGVPGRSHVIEAATNLSPPAAWSPLITNATDGSGILNVTNLPTGGFPQRFYRAREFP